MRGEMRNEKEKKRKKEGIKQRKGKRGEEEKKRRCRSFVLPFLVRESLPSL